MGIETSFEIIGENKKFPTLDIMKRNARYRLNEARRDGSYADSKYLIVMDGEGNKKRLAWKVLKLNKFKLYTNKMDSLIFNREPVITAGDPKLTKDVNDLVERTNWLYGIRKAVRNMETYGDAPIKTYSCGVSSFSPVNCFKIVDESNVDNVKAYILYEYIKDDKDAIKFIRFETHIKGFVYDIYYEYNGSTIGKSIEYNDNNRVVPIGGIWYETGVDEYMVQWLSCDTGSDGVYGQSPYEDFAELVHEAERRQTLQIKILDAHSEPMLAVGMGMLRENEYTGKVEAFDILGNILEVPNGQMKPEYITWDGKLDSNKEMLDTLFSEIYEISELGRTFMTGEYQGNISEETLSSLVKSAVDKGERHVWDIYYEVRKSLYLLCKLNGLDVSINDLNIIFQVGQTDSLKTISDVINSRVEKGTISVRTALQRYDGLTEKQAEDEYEKIIEERGGQ